MTKTNYLMWALNNLLSDAHLIMCVEDDWDEIDWRDYPENKRPSKEVVLAEIQRIKLEDEPKNNFVINRVNAYPPIGDQLDALYHAGVFPPEMAEKIKAVKDSFPKPDAASGNL